MNPLSAIIVAFLNWLAARLGWKTSPEGQEQAKASRAEANRVRVDAQVAKAQKAVTSGDEDEVAKTMREHGLLLAIGCLLLAGCATTPKVVYIQADDAPRRYTLDGKAGWWLPDATMARLLEKAIRNDAKPEVKP